MESGWSEWCESVTALHGSINYGGSSALSTAQHWTRGLLTLTSVGTWYWYRVHYSLYNIHPIHCIHCIHCILHWSHLRQKQHRTVRTLHRGHRSSGATQTFQNSPTISSLHTLYTLPPPQLQVLGPLLTVTVLEHLRCDACSSSV